MGRKPSRPYDSLQDWMERTGHNQTMLRRLLLERENVFISNPHMSSILTGRYRCSLPKALALSRVTGVPVENLVKWPRASRVEVLDSAVENEVSK
jgi:hypothetical protein